MVNSLKKLLSIVSSKRLTKGARIVNDFKHLKLCKFKNNINDIF